MYFTDHILSEVKRMNFILQLGFADADSDHIRLQGEFPFYVEAQIALILNGDYMCSLENNCTVLSLEIRPIKPCLFRETAARKVT